ncbi:Putative methyltransferase [Legionella lansingensis]|uniref:Putative methyltransferase n=1 Tax=Legionella lansingensis TaxID=45067 RepID=A0A0W0VL07_9GAMM|nr:class I SAM-dependent methyltransferase [Legionella lansingensis]KTD20799.1 putative methyltransferase [Legionella lansingensis]SNV49869.1 Putative methyltransferase [Legionella lansingensis]
MTEQDNESYDFEIPEEGLDYEILDSAFNSTTEAFIKVNGIQPGMRVLDVGSGSGIMTHYLARQVGQHGHVLSIDNSPEQLGRARRYCEQQSDKNISFKVLSIYELNQLNEHFDFIYCRFVLHHLHSPRLAINLFYQALNKEGIYIAEEGIVSAGFAYPPSKAWQYNRPPTLLPEEEKEGTHRDGEFGMKLYYWMKKSGFTIRDAKLVQPLLITYKQKKRLVDGHDAYKKTALLHDQSEADWEEQRQELMRLASDDFSIVGFYQSCQVCGIKS